jgi:hypothetical protein
MQHAEFYSVALKKCKSTDGIQCKENKLDMAFFKVLAVFLTCRAHFLRGTTSEMHDTNFYFAPGTI